MTGLNTVLRFAALLVVSTAASAAVPTLDPKPQAYSNTCQSYSLAYALAATGLPGTDVATIGRLREQELALRGAIDAIAKAQKASPYSHTVWQEAVRQHTGGKVVLRLEYVPDEVAFFERVRALTNSWDASQSLAASYFGVAKPVMTSATRVGKESYGSGHIVTVLGVDSRPMSPTPLAVLNSAVKHGQSTKNSCEPGDLPGDERYTAQAAVVKDYELKRFGGGILLMHLQKTK